MIHSPDLPFLFNPRLSSADLFSQRRASGNPSRCTRLTNSSARLCIRPCPVQAPIAGVSISSWRPRVCRCSADGKLEGVFSGGSIALTEGQRSNAGCGDAPRGLAGAAARAAFIESSSTNPRMATRTDDFAPICVVDHRAEAMALGGRIESA